ncbi:lysozyme inhibitor LprI family protein [Alteromonas sp. H39]|uniref:lysozyme inhibitor LprI family protein n=1 Tax=Alteromonas sp. H39 TaxID=3389876 RepID=UPI0039DF5A5E
MRFYTPVLAVVFLLLGGCQQSSHSPDAPASAPVLKQDDACPAAVLSRVQYYLSVQDGQGHGPDPGSHEWYGSVEHQLARQGQSSFPEGGTLAWCDSVLAAQNVKPTFSCHDNSGQAEQAICQSASLAALDTWLEDTYMNALRTVDGQQETSLKAMQRGWIKGRDACWQATDISHCVREQYIQRISELQAQYALVEPMAQTSLVCPGERVYTVRFFNTPEPAMVIEGGPRPLLLWQMKAASGTRYEGANTLYWEHHGEAEFISGVGAESQVCRVTTIKNG